MVDWTIQQLDEAAKRGARPKVEPRAVAVSFERDSGIFVLKFDNGTSFAFPADLVEGLSGASSDDLANVEMLGDGFGLHWEALDVDYTVAALAAGLFGTTSYLARRAGQTRSEAKASAARLNGAAGGRPRKQAG